MKRFVTALVRRNSETALEYLQTYFAHLSQAKVRAGIFVGPEIKKLMQDPKFLEKLDRVEKRAWHSFISVVYGFLGNNRFSRK